MARPHNQQDPLGPLFPAFASLSLAPPSLPPPPPRPPALPPPQTALQVSPFPRRPPLGTTGRPLQIRTNFFPILTLPGANIHHYDVRIFPDTNPRTSRRLYALWEDMHSRGGGLLVATKPVFDGRRNLFAPRALGLAGDEATFELELLNDDAELFPARARQNLRRFQITLKKVGEINMAHLHDFLEGNTVVSVPSNAVVALDILLRHRPSMLYTTVGKCFYTPEGAAQIANGAELWQGFHQSARPARSMMLLNLDVSATAFYEAGPVVDIIARIIGRRSAEELREPLSERDRVRVEKALRGVKIVTTHRGSGKRKWKIARLTLSSAARTTFPMKEEGGREETVQGYFRERYGVDLRFSFLPCLVVGDPLKNVFLPAEVCVVLQGQRILRKLNEKQTSDMIRFTCQPPSVRSQKISSGFNLLLTSDNAYLSDFNVSISREMATVNARVLPVPTLSYHPSSRESTIVPREGSWNLRDKKVAQGATLHAWSAVIFASERDMPIAVVSKFLQELVATCVDTGLDVRHAVPPIRHANPSGNIEAVLKASFMDAGTATGVKPDLVFCVLPNSGVPLYAEIKR
ncbi:hypothetical protein BDK51DRAFT_17710, partial [Blyttiomyces helicus]